MLLGRLGQSYAAALDSHRQVLRRAWAGAAGTEMGTEGDGFFVAFSTAPAAASAAIQAQRELASYPWPEGVPLRVRMGIHTGAPTLHDDGYVGMDVHRAARIAAAAHGGQVVISSATAELVGGSLPDGVGVRDLGSYRLKDISRPEHLHQLDVAGLQVEFPPLKTLGSASSLPVPMTPLVGREGELVELASMLSSPGVRLMTLTGPGGSGKSRLAIGLAQGLTDAFPDGVFFVPLAAITTADAMWTTIAEALDLPAEGRAPPGLFSFVAHRSALLVLDNLEQLAGADSVVAQLLSEALQVTVLATSRRPLHLPAEHEHAVPPLELPDEEGVDAVARSGAAQLFAQQARRVRPGFELNIGNANDVAGLCRRLDGLPLAIELVAARTKLLSPRALLTRLDTVLDMAAGGSQGPSRQRTLRDTIAWSYDLLIPRQQGFFRELGVFAGGADLYAISAVTNSDNGDPLDVVADLVDASLVTVTETLDGEPRFAMLETVRAFADHQLTATGERDTVRARHAHHYLEVAEELSLLLDGPRYIETRNRFETEHDNFREALSWALQLGDADANSVERVRLGLRLCVALGEFWFVAGYWSEARQWREHAVEAGESDGPELARCLSMLADSLSWSGDSVRAQQLAETSVSMWRRLDGHTDGLVYALTSMTFIALSLGQANDARSVCEEALAAARDSGDKLQLFAALEAANVLESHQHNHQRSLELSRETLAVARDLNAPFALSAQGNIASSLRQLGRADEAQRVLRPLIPQQLSLAEPISLLFMAEDYAAILAELGDHRPAVKLLGAAEAMRQRLGFPPAPRWQQEEIAAPIAKAKAALSAQEWNRAYQAGRLVTVEDALTEAHEADGATRESGSSGD